MCPAARIIQFLPVRCLQNNTLHARNYRARKTNNFSDRACVWVLLPRNCELGVRVCDIRFAISVVAFEIIRNGAAIMQDSTILLRIAHCFFSCMLKMISRWSTFEFSLNKLSIFVAQSRRKELLLGFAGHWIRRNKFKRNKAESFHIV